MNALFTNPDAINLNNAQRNLARQLLANSFHAARAYRGTEGQYDRLTETLIMFERYAEDITRKITLSHDERETIVTQNIRQPSRPITVQDLLGIAAATFSKRLKTKKIDVLEIETPFHFLPTHGLGASIEIGSGAGFEKGTPEPRTERLIKLLNQRGIYTDDIVIYRGVTKQGTIRQTPYSIVQIPRLNREVAICDETGQASFVGQGQRGPLFWATHRKDQLDNQTGITRVVHNDQWEARMLELLLTDNAPQPKIRITRGNKQFFPLTVDIILIKALEYAVAHDGKLPIAKTKGEVPGLSGEKWTAWEVAIQKNEDRALNIDAKGLAHLFRLYGLKTGLNENKETITKAIERLKATGEHGLTRQPEILFTSDFILIKALEYAAADKDGNLPSHLSGEVAGVPGQTWGNVRQIIKNKSYGFELDNVHGLGHLFRVFGLKNGKAKNPAVIAKAQENIRNTGHHGLVRQDEEVYLTSSYILTKALEYAATHKGKLPTQDSGDVDGLPGQNWKMVNSAIHHKSRGFELEKITGLPHLFQSFGLKDGRKEIPEAIAQAQENIRNTGHHGLKLIVNPEPPPRTPDVDERIASGDKSNKLVA